MTGRRSTTDDVEDRELAPRAPTPWVIGSLFVTAIAKDPISAATAWLHRK